MLIINGNITLDGETVIGVLDDKENKMLHSEMQKQLEKYYASVECE